MGKSKSSVEPLLFNGIEAFRLQAASGATALVSRFGGQVLSWRTADGCEQLFLSERARYDGSASIRGGIPVCFPQFSGLGDLPKHGLVRNRVWTPSGENCRDGYALLSLAVADDAQSRTLWPHPFRAEITVAIQDNRLDVELEVENTGADTFSFTAALHTYLRVKEVEQIAVQGLRGLEYRDAGDGDRIKRETSVELAVDGEVDRVYHEASAALLLSDGGRHLGIHSDGFPDAVVWNPWVNKCAALDDMAPLDFRHMICIEAAVAHRPFLLRAGESWAGRQSLVAI